MMRNKILEEVIDEVVDKSEQSPEFKATFKQYIRNKFDGNANDNDLKTVLSLIDDSEAVLS